MRHRTEDSEARWKEAEAQFEAWREADKERARQRAMEKGVPIVAPKEKRER